MDINVTFEDGNRVYSLVLSRRDFDDICSGFSEGGSVVGRHSETQTYFHIMDGIGISDMWRRMEDGYYLGVGVAAPVPAPGATSAEWDRLAGVFYSRLEDAINKSGRIPLEGDLLLAGVRSKMGYVEMRVEKE